eukprot:scaffold4680_cov164-Skeletonema_marinoi.AAC.15
MDNYLPRHIMLQNERVIIRGLNGMPPNGPVFLSILLQKKRGHSGGSAPEKPSSCRNPAFEKIWGASSEDTDPLSRKSEFGVYVSVNQNPNHKHSSSLIGERRMK